MLPRHHEWMTRALRESDIVDSPSASVLQSLVRVEIVDLSSFYKRANEDRSRS